MEKVVVLELLNGMVVYESENGSEELGREFKKYLDRILNESEAITLKDVFEIGGKISDIYMNHFIDVLEKR